MFACYEMWDKLGDRNCLAPPVVVYAVYKSLGDVWNKVRAPTDCSCLVYSSLLFAKQIFERLSRRGARAYRESLRVA